MNDSAANGIKKCKKCLKSKEDGAVFGFSKPYVSPVSGEIFNYENLVCNFCLSLGVKEYRKNNLDKTRETKRKRKEKFKGTILYHVQNKISSYKREAQKTNVPFNLTIEHLVNLYEEQGGLCHYSNEKLIFGYVDGKPHHNTLSLDKLDPKKGYVIGNVVWCGYLVNTMKQNMTKEDFFNYMKKILILNNEEFDVL